MPETKPMMTDSPKFCAWLLRSDAERAEKAGEAILMSPALARVIADHLERTPDHA